jgi:ATP-dependent Lhr-like helicase
MQGRWSLRKREAPTETSARGYQEADPQTVEYVVHALLRRYGVVFWRMLQREAGWLPPWRELLRVLRRLEARGDIRGGRFVASVSGEQFALPEAVKMLRDTRRAPLSGQFVAVSGADPLNLVGIILPGAKVSALTGNRVLYRDGVAVGALVGGDIQWLEPLEAGERNAAEDLLVRQRAGSPLLAYVR